MTPQYLGIRSFGDPSPNPRVNPSVRPVTGVACATPAPGQHLRRLGITRASLFPDLDGIAQHTNSRFTQTPAETA